MRLDVNLTQRADIQARMADIVSEARAALAATAEDIEELVEAAAAKHNKTGALVRSIFARPNSDGTEWTVGHDLQAARHALFVHWGTKPHVITPKKKKILRWPSGGKFAFARKAKHPGYKGDPWLVRAAAQAPQIFEQHLTRMLSRKPSSGG